MNIATAWSSFYGNSAQHADGFLCFFPRLPRLASPTRRWRPLPPNHGHHTLQTQLLILSQLSSSPIPMLLPLAEERQNHRSPHPADRLFPAPPCQSLTFPRAPYRMHYCPALGASPAGAPSTPGPPGTLVPVAPGAAPPGPGGGGASFGAFASASMRSFARTTLLCR